MFSTIRNAWAIPDLRKKLIYTILLLVVFRLGSHIPVPGINTALMTGMGEGTLFELLNLMTGGAFAQMTIFAMGIAPYINASIIMQLLTVAVPAFERMQKEGEEGRKKLAQYQRYGTVALAALQAWGIYALLLNGFGGDVSLINNPGWQTAAIMIISFTAGTAFLMWLGEQITEKGIGNGISLIIFAGIVSRVPVMVEDLITGLRYGTFNFAGIALILAVALLVIGFVVQMNEAERRIPVQYAKRVVGRKMYGGQSTHIPIKVASAGVIPIIFAMSIMAFPGTIAMMFGAPLDGGGTGFWAGFARWMSPNHAFYAVASFLLIIFFTYFYTAIQFNPVEMGNNMKKNGGFIPGIRPGRPTSDYIAKVLGKITTAGAIFIAFIAVFPMILSIGFNFTTFAIGGSALLIVVGVALETVRQLESQMLMRHYKGFLE